MQGKLSPEDLEYLSQFEVTEGKQNGSTEKTPPESQTKPPAGDSSSGDISLESQDLNPFLLTEEELQGSEEEIYDKISGKLKAIGIDTKEYIPGLDGIKLISKKGPNEEGYTPNFARRLTDDNRAEVLSQFNEFILKNGDAEYADKAILGKESILDDYYNTAVADKVSLEDAKKSYVGGYVANWERREKEKGNMGMGSYIKVNLEEDDFDTPEQYEMYKSWKDTGVVPTDEATIKATQEEMAFNSKNRKSQKFIDNLDDESKEAISAKLSQDVAIKQHRIKNIDQERLELEDLNKNVASRIDYINKNGGTQEEIQLLKSDLAGLMLTNNEFNDFIEEVSGDTGDLMLAAENFNKNYNLIDKLGSGFKDMGLSISHGAAQFLAYAAGNNIGGMPLGGVFASEVDQAFMPALESMERERARFAQGPTLKDAYNGDFDDVVDWVANTATQAVPSLSLAFTGPAAMPLFFFSGYGSTASELALNEHRAVERMIKNRKLLDAGGLNPEQEAIINAQMEEDAKTASIADWRKVGLSTLAGAAEVTFEKLGTLAILKGANKAVNPTTLRAAGRRFLLDANREGMSEAATEMTNNVGKMIFMGEDVNLFEGVGEAYAGGALIGGPLSLKGSVPIVYEYAVSTLMDANTRRQINSKLKQLEELTGFKNLDNVLNTSAMGPQMSPEVQQLVDEINKEIDLLKDGVASRVGNDLTNEEVYQVSKLTMEMQQINKRFTTLAKKGVGGAELQAAEKTLRAKFDKLAEQREAILTKNADTKAAKDYNAKLKVSMDAKGGYAEMLKRQAKQKQALSVQAFENMDAASKNEYLEAAKNSLEENATAEEIRMQAYKNFYVEKNKQKLEANKESAKSFYEANDLDVQFIELTGEEYAAAAVKNNADPNSEGFITGDNKIIVNPDIAAANGRTNVWAHETLHAIVGNKLGSDASANKAGQELLSWLETNSPDVHAYVIARLETSYINKDGSKLAAYYEEAMNVLSDYIAEGNTVDITTLGQMRLMINKIFSKGKSAIELEDAGQTFAFIATYSNKNKNSKTANLIKEFGKAMREEEEEKKGKSKLSSSDISSQADRAKRVMEKVSSNMEFFDPNSPLIARVLPGMIQAQLAKLSNKGLQFDMEEAVSDIILRLYSNQDIGKFDGRGTLYGYVNGRISFRIKDMLKASGEGKNDIVEDFNQSDVEDLKGAAADITTVEQIEERTEAERPQYKTLLEKNVVEAEVLETIKEKIPRIVGTLKNRMDEAVSKNRTVTPLVNELRLALGKQIDIDLKKQMGGKKDGQLRKWLTSRKKVLLENMTTTYLMSAIPIAVQKKVDGVWTSDWKGKKVDRETTSTDMAGRTSGAEMVRRLPQASIKIDDRTFLSYILEESGNPIRGKKESWAKAIAEELAIEIVNEEMQNPDSKIRQAFEANQERLGAELVENWTQKLSLDLERGNVKYSKSFTTEFLQSEDFAKQTIAFKDLIRSGNHIDEIINPETFEIKSGFKNVLFTDGIGELLTDLYNSSIFEDFVESGMKDRPGFMKSVIKLPYVVRELGDKSPKGSLYRSGNENFATEIVDYLKDMSTLRDLLGRDILNVLGYDIFGLKGGRSKIAQRVRNEKLGLKLARTQSPSLYPPGLDLSKVHKYTTGVGLLGQVNRIQSNKNLSREEKEKEYISSGLRDQIIEANTHNKMLASHVAYTLAKAYRDGLISGKNLIYMLQDQSNILTGFRSLTSLDYITFVGGEFQANKIEHLHPNSDIMLRIAEIAFNKDISDLRLKSELSRVFKDVATWADNANTTKALDAFGKTNLAGESRMLIVGDRINTITHSTGINAGEYIERWEAGQFVQESLKINLEESAKAQERNKPSAKNSSSIPQAIFMVGGAGSGKSSIIKNLGLVDKGYRLINQDPYLEKYIAEAGLPTDESTYDKEQRSIRAKLGWKARKAAEQDLADNTAAKESMIVDGTGGSYKATTKKMKALEDAGFEIHMIFVNTSKSVASQRNAARTERSLPDFVVNKNWDQVQESAKQYREDYAGRFYEINTDKLQYGEALPQEFVDAVNTGLNESKVRMSNSLSFEFNEMIQRQKNVAADKTYSTVQAKMMGEKKGKYRLFVPSSADDFRGLTSYTFAGKGKQGEADQKFFEENLINPYVRGTAQIEAVKQQIRREYYQIAKAHKKHFKMLGKKIENTDFTYDQALRVYMWTQQGIEVPGMDKDDINFLINAVQQHPGLIEVGNAMQAISRQDTWVEPGPYWMSNTLVSDLNSMTEKVGRRKYLQEFIENSEVIFSPENLNKIEAVYGTRHREAIEDALYSMKNGRNRPTGMNKQMNQWLNWVNNSTGAIMFFNIRSAVLQTLSSTNFINWSDNNPLKAAAAFANQKQYWSDFVMIFNSDKLKQRRSGLQTDVNEAEIANQADGAKNKASAVIAYLLKIGFTPTQIADSFAIATGGATFYRNRVNTYLKQGMEQEAAEKKAFEDFSKTADEAQQSSDPYLVSQEQRSPLGRLVLAFQNTPMQYTRLMKKAMLDLANGRGDAKTHISKIIYYGAVQNLIFSALQSALFAAIPGFDDEEDESGLTPKELEKKREKEQRKEDTRILRIVNSMTDSILKGSGVKGAVLATIKNTITEYFKQEEKGFTADHTYTILQALSLSPPIGSKARKIYSAIQGKKFEKDVLEARGFSVMKDGRINLSPAYSIIGSLASGVANVPMDRMVDIITSYSEALDKRNTAWQRIALALGWKTWDVNAKNEEHDLIKTEAKAKRKEEGKKKAAETRRKKREEKEKNMETVTFK